MNWKQFAYLLAAVAVAFVGWHWYFGGLGVQALARQGEVQSILVIGDSLTSGVGNDNVSRYWPEILADRLGAQEVVTLAHQGDTAASAWGRWETHARNQRWKAGDADWQPDLVVVCLGGNDVLRARGRSALEADLNRWAEALAPLDAPVLFVAVPGGVLGPMDIYSGLWEDVAGRHGMHEMNSRTLRRVFTSNNLTVDRIHMNQDGQAFFAERVYRRVTGRGR